MNKQELIKKLKSDLTATSEFERSKYQYGKGYRGATKQHLEMLSDLDEPQKPVVPKFAADWIEKCKRGKKSLYYALESSCKVSRWLERDEKIRENEDIFARAWLDGYEVEKEKLYTVEIPNPNLNAHTILKKTDNGIVLIGVTHARWRGWENSKLTESEIKQDFEWAFQFAKEVEE